MSRKNPRQYAAALTEVLHNTPASNVGAVCVRFVSLLQRHRMLSKADRIVREVCSQWNRRHGIVDVSIRSATPLLKKTLDAIGVAVQKSTDAKRANVVAVENAALLGGAIIQYGDTRIDGSVRRRLQSLKESMTR